MFIKRALSVSLFAGLVALTTGCSSTPDFEGSCERQKELCSDNALLQAFDCAALAKVAEEQYDNATDEQKDASKKQADCIDDAADCEAASKCSGN